jgi:hypothetical protein
MAKRRSYVEPEKRVKNKDKDLVNPKRNKKTKDK